MAGARADGQRSQVGAMRCPLAVPLALAVQRAEKLRSQCLLPCVLLSWCDAARVRGNGDTTSRVPSAGHACFVGDKKKGWLRMLGQE